ncbi:MAG: NAD(P)-binding protein [Pseudomonadales bacterium]|nr:NAD(P)-binding protein [Pseudomonadales bacterium]
MLETDVVIIGAGLSGILACKYIKNAGLDCIVFEGTDDIGGVWKYREEPNGKGGVMLSTVSTSSKSVNEFSDFPMPNEYPPFQKHTQVWKYLNDYADNFELRERILLNSEIHVTKKEGDRWISTDNNGENYKSKYLIVCSGMHQFPSKPYLDDPIFENATFQTMHSSEYKRIKEEFLGKDVLIYGGGETGSDIAIELTHAAKSVTMAIPNGQWLFPSITPVRIPTNESDSAPMVADTFSSRLRRLVDPPFATYDSRLDTMAHFTSQTFIKWGGKCGHGISEWENDAPYYGQFFNKNSNVIQMVHRGQITPKGKIKAVAGNTVEFIDNSKMDFDLVVFCTGYKTRFPFLKDSGLNSNINDQFKFCLHNDDQSLAFVGFARPLVGSFMGLSEMQSLFVSKIFSQEIPVPDREFRDKSIMEDKVFQGLIFSGTTNRINGLVNFQSYMDDLASIAGVRPDYWKLFFSSPTKWFYAVTAAHNNCQFLLHDESYHDEIFRRYKMYHGSNLRVSTHIYALIVNIFSGWWSTKYRPFHFVFRSLAFVFRCLLIIIFSPVLLYRIFYPLDIRWKKKKHRMLENNKAMEMLEQMKGNQTS